MEKIKFFYNTLCLLAVLLITVCNNDSSSSKVSTRPEPAITSIAPNNSSSIGIVSISSIRGTNFSADAEISLSRVGESDIMATSVVMVNKETLTCDFDLTGAATGEWDIVITVPEPGGGTATLSSGFTVTNALYVSTTGDDANAGTASAPKLTVGAAITAATSGREIRVSAGTYYISSTIAMKEGVSLYGGYDPVTWERDITTNISRLEGTQTTGGDVNATVAVLNCGDTITGATVIDGLTIIGSSSGANGPGAIMTAGSPVISNNILNGGTGVACAIAIRASPHTSEPKIYYNTINGGTTSGGGFSYAIYTALVEEDTLICGNFIHGGSGTISCGIYMRQGSEAYICNNTIYGGGVDTGGHSCGIYCYNNGSETFIIRNNTIDGGLGFNNYSYGIRVYISSPIIENNIIFSSGNNYRYGIYEDDAASDPASVKNNSIFECGTALYYDEGNIAITTVAGLNLIAGAALNISIDGEFADKTGGDWHLTADTPATITTGGLNGYDESWAFFPQTGSSFIDKDMVLRPASGTGWAMGAYQYVSP